MPNQRNNPSRNQPERASPAADAESSSLKIVGIGASAGGLEAFTELLRNLPTEARVAYVLVQHLDPTHRSLLSELLGRTATLPVREIAHGTRVEANQIYVIPPNCDLAIEQGVLHLSPREKKNAGPARSIDRFLASLAADQKQNAIGVILSGAGSDGAKGLKAIKDAGGVTFAQDGDSSKYDSMPRSAVGTGCVDFVLPPEKIAAEIGRLLQEPGHTRLRAAANARRRRGRVTARSSITGVGAREATAWPAAPEDLNLRKIFLLLRTRTGIDFSLYRPNTIRRRLNRRLALHKLENLEAYVSRLREEPAEIEALYRDLLINVTSFFRNPKVFDFLKRKIFSKLAKDRQDGEGLRFWVAGCSTGQEAYSLAIAYTEFAESAGIAVPAQIFATDVNAAVLEIARAGRYGKPQLTGLSVARQERFFVRENDQFRVQKPIRDMVIFAQQNLLTDPPFTRVDLISCRNMLIYIEPALQQKIIPAFHYALRAGGYLVLGTSESVGQFTNFFASAEKSHKIYSKKPAASWLRYERPPAPPALRSLTPAPVPPVARQGERELSALDAYKEADRLTLAKYAPVGVLVNEEGEILQFRGDAQRYLGLPSGKATFNVFKMAREGLGLALQKALQRARQERRVVRERGVRCDSRRGRVNFEVVPLKNLRTRCYLILFEKCAPAAKPAVGTQPPLPAGGSALTKADARLLADLKRDYAEAREHLDSLREEHETAVEELQASNEEVQSSNEELQSLNEELETSNEELESANEELTTLNEELATRNGELRESEQRLREQAQLLDLAPVLARSPKDRIIFWNRGTEKLYGFTREEAMGQTSHLFLGAQFAEPLAKIQAEFQRHGRWEGEVLHRRKDGAVICVASQWVLHHDGQGKVRGILEVNTEITARKAAEKALRDTEEFNQRILQSSPDCIEVLDPAGRLVYMTAGGQKLMEIEDFSTVASAYWPAFWAGDGRIAAEKAYREALAGELSRFQGFCRTTQGTPKWWDVMVRPILDARGRPEKLLAVLRDITEQKQAELAAAEQARVNALRADIASEVARSGELQPILRQIAELLVQHLDAAFARIWTMAEDSLALEVQASAGRTTYPNGGYSCVRVGEGRIGRIASTRQPHLSNDVPSDPEIAEPEWALREGMIAFAGYPLVSEEGLLGVVAVFARHPLEPRVLKELRLSAEGIAQLIKRKNTEKDRTRLYHEAMTARNEALAASRAKDDFLAALSHELRTPLNPVLLLASDSADNTALPVDVRVVFATIRDNVSLEARLIDDLLDLTRIAHGKLILLLKPVDVHAVLRDAISVVSADVDEKRLSLSLALAAERTIVLADAMRLQQVFWNVLKNAVKFTPAGGTVSVETTVATDTDRVVIRITDSGVGLSSADLERIFAAFSQAENRYGGLGLGLTISRQLIEKHGGHIRATSPGLGQGATFEIDLPLTRSVVMPEPADGDNRSGGRPAPRSEEMLPRPTVPRAQRRILLIEDHSATRNALQHLLERRKFDVFTAGTLAEARERIDLIRFDIVISDLGLPDGDGCAFWQEVRTTRPGTIGVALSGYGMDEDVARSQAAGFAEHLMKPVTMDALDRALNLLTDGHSNNHLR